MPICIDPHFAQIIPPLQPDERAQLEANILRDGCQEPLSLWGEILIDGHNRYEICTRNRLPFKTVSVALQDRDHAIAWIGERQLGRRNLTDDQRAIIADEVREVRSKIARSERAEDARAVQLRGLSVNVSDKPAVPPLPPPPSYAPKTDTRVQTAQEFHLPERKLRYAQTVKKAAPEIVPLVRSGEMTLVDAKRMAALAPPMRVVAMEAVKSGSDVRAAVRAAKKQDYNERIEMAAPKPLQGTYRILYADPPWKYVGLNQADEYGHAERHYDCLDDIQLSNFKPDGIRLVRDVMDRDSVLFMWVTSPLLERCFPIIRSWGFEYKSSFVWDKVLHNMGHYNSVRHELLLVCVRGSCKPDVSKLVDSVQSIERTVHSRKPHEFYDIIEGLYDHGRKLELFCRTPRDGWDCAGNES